jgi:hypothetical protein
VSRAAILAIAIALAAPATASASFEDDAYRDYSPATISAGWQKRRAFAIARIVWHHPCVDRMTYAWVDPRSDLADARAATVSCAVRLRTQSLSWADICVITLHEAGHLANFRDSANVADPVHSLNPRSVMHSPMMRVDPRCRDRGRPYLERHGWLQRGRS